MGAYASQLHVLCICSSGLRSAPACAAPGARHEFCVAAWQRLHACLANLIFSGQQTVLWSPARLRGAWASHVRRPFASRGDGCQTCAGFSKSAMLGRRAAIALPLSCGLWTGAFDASSTSATHALRRRRVRQLLLGSATRHCPSRLRASRLPDQPCRLGTDALPPLALWLEACLRAHRQTHPAPLLGHALRLCQQPRSQSFGQKGGAAAPQSASQAPRRARRRARRSPALVTRDRAAGLDVGERAKQQKWSREPPVSTAACGQ